jgi:hypothetical protein
MSNEEEYEVYAHGKMDQHAQDSPMKLKKEIDYRISIQDCSRDWKKTDILLHSNWVSDLLSSWLTIEVDIG